MKILELTNFSAGGCGVWARVRQESTLLAEKGHEVRVFSSNFTKGSNETALAEEKMDKVRISRFPAIKLGGESFMLWNFEREALEFRPDVIIAHSYRHPHTLKALRIAKKLGCKVFLVTHAPFGRERGLISNIIVSLYDSILGKKNINRFDKIICITKWELPYLKELGVNESKLSYIPNGIPDEFLEVKSKNKPEHKILFIGRLSPIKNLDLVIESIAKINDKKLIFEIVGPAEEEYLKKLKFLVSKLDLDKRIVFSGPIYGLKPKISKIDSSEYFILPSHSEGMPQSLIEALARGKLCLASDNPGNAELIVNEKNGFLFKNNNSQDLIRVLNNLLSLNDSKKQALKEEARNSVLKFAWKDIINKIQELIHEKSNN